MTTSTATQSSPADLFIAAVRARGSDAKNVRDAAHEACHALECGMTKPWEREALHRAITKHCMKKGRSQLLMSEILARAVEQLVCRRLGVKVEPVEHWAFLACMEAIKFRYPYAGVRVEMMKQAIESAMTGDEADEMAKRVLALGGAA